MNHYSDIIKKAELGSVGFDSPASCGSFFPQGCIALLAVCLFLLPQLSAVAGPLEDYLAHPPTPAKPWNPGSAPEERVPKLLDQLHSSPREYDRGMAVANLADAASGMASTPGGSKAAADLLERYVFPSLSYTRHLPATSICCWRNVVSLCYTIYGKIPDIAGQERCLKLLMSQSPVVDEREFASYSLARLVAHNGRYTEAIRILQGLPAQSRWTKDRAWFCADWKKKQKELDHPTRKK